MIWSLIALEILGMPGWYLRFIICFVKWFEKHAVDRSSDDIIIHITTVFILYVCQGIAINEIR